MNLCELPFATLSERAGKRQVLRFEIEDFDRTLNETVRKTLTVTGDPEHGLPTAMDEEIYLGLLKYTSDLHGFSTPEVRFSRAELFDLMGWKKTDWAYARLTLGMHRLVGVRLSYQNYWRDNRDKQWRDQGAFGILDSFQFRDSRQANSGAAFVEQSSVFRWSAVLFQSFDSGYLKKIDYALVRSLGVTARRLYRYLDKHFHPPKKTRIEIDLHRLAYQHIGISRGIAPDKVRKRYLAPATEELEQAGYLKETPAEQRFVNLKRGRWNVRFELAISKKKALPVSHSQSDCVAAICRRGISAPAATRFANDHPWESLEPALHAMDEQRNKGQTIRDPDRWLNAALVKNYRASGTVASMSQRPELRLFRKGRFEN